MTRQLLSTTGGYLHAADDIKEIRFPVSGKTDRSFTILKAVRAKESQSPDHAGIAILDNDNGLVVVDGIQSAEGNDCPSLAFKMALITSMEWREFARFCRSQPRYRGGIQDIDRANKCPLPGDPIRQSSLGLTPTAKSDARSDFFRDLSENPDVPYEFPAMSLEQMSDEICRHPTFVENGGISARICWDIRLNFSWNRTGRVKDGPQMSDAYDLYWRHEVSENPLILERAKNGALSEFLKPDAIVLGLEEFPCTFSLAGSKKGFLTLDRFAGCSMCATRDIDIAGRILRLRDNELEALWAILRVMDVETEEQHRRHTMEWQMHLQRRAFEGQPQETVS